MSNKPYYLRYEDRYKQAYEAGIKLWGHTEADEELSSTLSKWVKDNNLYGKRIIDFGCGEGAGGVILSQLGCIYHGVDIAPSAIEKARSMLEKYPNATVSVHNLVEDDITEKYDAAIDIMGLHVIVLDDDRKKYLVNAYNCLKDNAPMLFFREWYEKDVVEEVIDSIERWAAITGIDYTTPKIKTVSHVGKEVEVNMTYIPARGNSKEGYIKEMCAAGFEVEHFVEMEPSIQIPHSASIFVRKP